MKISRRSLISAAAAAAAVPAALPARAADPCLAPQKWDEEREVIVIGAGGAGLTAAITAKEAGADVVVLEQQAFAGGNTSISGGGFNAAVEADSKAAGVEDSPELHCSQTLAAGDHRADPELVRVLTAGAPESIQWLRDRGVKFREGIYPEFPCT